MDKKTLYHIIEWVVALAACAYLVYRLVIFDDYAALWASLCGMSWLQIGALVLCIALMPVNMSLEAWRWRTLWNVRGNDVRCTKEGVKELSWHEAHRQVYYSKLAGLITPWRLGEYPSRAILMARTMDDGRWTTDNVWSRVLSMGAVGSATMTIAIIIAGVIGMVCSPSVFTYLGGSYLYSLCAAIIVLAILFAAAPRLLKRWAKVNHDLMLRSIGQSFVRLACWCVQLALVLYALNALQLSTFHFQLFPIYYLLVTITPNVPIAEVGVRGAWAIVVFGSMNAAFAGVLLWVINTLLPCLMWFFIKKR